MFKVLPHTLQSLSAEDLGFNLICLQALERDQRERIQSLPKGSLQAVIVYGE